MPPRRKKVQTSRRPPRNKPKTPKKDPIYVDGERPRPLYIDYKDLDLLSKLTNRHGKIVSRRKTGCHAATQHAVAQAIKRARFMALMPYVGD
jgi:small subunit ribosomal protein S18